MERHFLKLLALIILSMGVGLFVDKAYSNGCPQWPDQSTRILDKSELENCDCWQLEILRNEIYARHGRKFKNKTLQKYFSSQSWYQFDPKNPEGNKGLNSFERNNAGIIAGVEREMGCHPGANATNRPSWPAQSTRRLTDTDLQNCDCRELELLRNEIFARHGRIFKRADLRRYFESKSWYRSDPDNPNGNKGLNEYEQKNAFFILNYEKAHGCKSVDD